MYKYSFENPVGMHNEQQQSVSDRPKYEVLSVSSPDSEVIWCTGPRISLVFVASDGPDGQHCWMMSGGHELES